MDRPIHICIVTSAHPVDDVRLQRKITDTFLARGFRVTWVGPDYQYVGESAASRPAGGCEYRLFPAPRSRMRRLFGRTLFRTAAAVEDVDVYFAPEPDSARIAVRLGHRRSARVIFDVHELYDQAHVTNWSPGPLRPLARRLLREVIRRTCARCDLVVGVSDGVLAPYRDALSNAMIVRNCAPLWFADAADAAGREHPGESPEGFRVMHGKTTVYNGTPTVLRAIAQARRDGSDVVGVMFEWFRESDAARREFAQVVADLDVATGIELHAPVPMDDMPRLLRSCAVGMISHGRMLAAGTQPNRLYEYMAAGLPVIAPSYDRGIAPVIEAEQCGMLVDSEEPAAIAAAILALHRDADERRAMGDRARHAFLARHNWEHEVEPLLTHIEDWFPRRQPLAGGAS